jgi:hypothetical protein
LPCRLRFSTLAKLILVLSTSVLALSAFRVIERLGKGFRGPPRDAWLAAIAARATRGYAFGVHKALDKAGAVAGPAGLRAAAAAGRAPQHLPLAVRPRPGAGAAERAAADPHPDRPAEPHPRESVRGNWQQLSPGFKRFLWPAGLFALGYFSLGFILLRAHAIGFSVAQVVLLYALFNAVCVAAAPAIGWLGDPSAGPASCWLHGLRPAQPVAGLGRQPRGDHRGVRPLRAVLRHR